MNKNALPSLAAHAALQVVRSALVIGFVAVTVFLMLDANGGLVTVSGESLDVLTQLGLNPQN